MLTTTPTNVASPAQGIYVAGSSGSYSTKAKARLTWAVDGDPATLTASWRYRVQVDAVSDSWATPIVNGTTTNLTLDAAPLPTGTVTDVRVRLENYGLSTSVGTFTVNTSTDVVTRANTLRNGDIVHVSNSGGALPSPLVAATDYYVISASGADLQLAATEAGAAIDLTTTGTGTHTLTLIQQNSDWVNILAGAFTTPSPATTNPEVPLVTDVVVSRISSTSVLVTWTRPTEKFTTFLLASVLTATGGGEVSKVVDGMDASATLSGLTADALHTISINSRAQYAADVSTVITVFPVTVDDVEASVDTLCTTASLSDTAPISGPTEVQLILGASAAANWTFSGLGAVVDWSLAPAVPGLTLSTPTGDKLLTHLDGAPAAEGVYRVNLVCRRTVGYTRAAFAYPVVLAVTGPLCLGWYHDDPSRIDLQPDSRSPRNVSSYAAGDSLGLASLRLTRGDPQRIHILPRNDPAAVTQIGLTIRLRDRLAGVILWSTYTSSPSTETIAGRTVAYVDVTPDSSLLDQIFAKLNANPLAEPLANSLAAEAELVWKTSGAIRTGKLFPVEIVQDSDR